MSVLDDPQTAGRARLSFAEPAEIDQFVETLARFERGEITPDEWRKYRLVRGTYGQRQAADAQMLRVKIPQGVLNGEQLRALANVAVEYSRGWCHITTRQNIQYHFVRLHDVELAMRQLADAGLTTREACGNSVRNIVSCPYAGVTRDEVFDVTPYAEAMTRYLLRHPLSAVLPRKFKIAFEGCPDDHAFSAINDIGYRAAVAPDGSTRHGFRVTVGGGTSIMCRTGAGLSDFIPAGDMFAVAEAVIRIFHRHGDYEHKHRNRLKFLIKQMGWEAFRAAVTDELDAIRAAGAPPLPFDPERPPVEDEPDWPRSEVPSVEAIADLAAASSTHGPGIHPPAVSRDGGPGGERTAWLASNVRPQKQAGYSIVTATLPLGDITAGQLRALAVLAESYGDGLVRTTPEQNVMLRWVKSGQLPAIYRRLAAAGLGQPGAGSIEDVTSCPGAESCRLAVTQSRGAASLIKDRLAVVPAVARAAHDVKIKISGCPNGCGQHHVAAIGLQGSIRKLGDRVLPQYFLFVGGGVNGEATFGRLAAKVPARRVPEAIERLVQFYERERQPRETAAAFFARVDAAKARAAIADLEQMTLDAARPEDFIDPGDDHAFVPDVQDGECSA
ncbi:MAG: nitrite/sulfite reductase [Acidobacteria bacterium]|nr:nitrite/sulfite reductase [Acidobacteriota bacterium]